MAAHVLRKASRQGLRFTTVELFGIRHVHGTAVPLNGRTLREQTEEALHLLDVAFRAQRARGSVIEQTVFLAQPSQVDECRRIVGQFHGADLPATSYVPQPPCDGSLLAIEAHAVARGRSEIEIERPEDQLVLLRQDGLSWAFCAPAVPGKSTPSVYEDTASTLGRIESLLQEGGFRFDQVLRTWLYLGGIVAPEGPTQRYKELNRARADFYQEIPFLADHPREGRSGRVFPASTGIGTEGRRLHASAVALASHRGDVIARPLENPRQTAAYDYSRTYSPRSPRFSRAMAVACGLDSIIFISGTASITHSESRHPGDAVAQTHETLDNIEALISEANLARHDLQGFGSSLEGLGVARVYVKRPEDYPCIREVCNRRLGDLPITYTLADVCRPELLVEIEGIAFSRREPVSSTSVPRGPHFRDFAPRPSVTAAGR